MKNIYLTLIPQLFVFLSFAGNSDTLNVITAADTAMIAADTCHNGLCITCMAIPFAATSLPGFCAWAEDVAYYGAYKRTITFQLIQ